MLDARASPLLVLYLLSQVGCQGGGGASDASVDIARVECSVVIGTGSARFEAVQAGQALPVIMGPQGGYHVLVAVRARGVSGDVYLDYETVRPADGVVVGGGRACVRLTPSPDEEGAAERANLFAIFDEPDLAAFRGEGMPMTVRVRLRSGADPLACRPPVVSACDTRASVDLRAVR